MVHADPHALPDAADLDLICPISQELMNDPVKALDGRTYERASFFKYVELKRQPGDQIVSPWTRQLIGITVTPDEDAMQRLTKYRVAVVAAAHAGRPTDSTELPPLTGFRVKLFEDMDRVRDLDVVKKLDLKPPSIIPIGDESAGKSTLLERLCGFPVLPRASGLCTRLPIRLRLRRGKFVMAKLSVWTRGAQRVPAPGFAEETVALEGMCEKVKTLMEKVVGPERAIVSDREIVIDVQASWAPDLDIIDLPGLVAANNNNAQQQNLHQATHNLVETVIDEEGASATFLLVLDASVRMNSCLAVGLVQRKKLQDRVLGVFTKLDRIQRPETDDETIAGVVTAMLDGKGSGAVALKTAIVACASRPPPSNAPAVKNASPELLRLHWMEVHENKELDHIYRTAQDPTHLTDEHKKRLGLNNVRERVQRHFEQFLITEWIPALQRKLTAYLVEQSTLHRNFGVPLPPHAQYQKLGSAIIDASNQAGVAIDSTTLLTVPAADVAATVVSRMHVVGQRQNPDWRTLYSMASLWDDVEAVRQHAAQWAPRTVSDAEAKTIAATELALLKEKLTRIQDALGSISRDSELAERLAAAIFTTHTEPASAATWRAFKFTSSVGAFFKSDAFKKLSDDEQAKLVQLGRFDELRELFTTHAGAVFSARAQPFREASEALVAGITRCVKSKWQRPPASETASPQCNMTYAVATVEDLPDALLDLWRDTVVHPAIAEIGQRVLASTTDAHLLETWRDDRLKVLSEMVKSAEVLKEIKGICEQATRDLQSRAQRDGAATA